jgi:hypothetical protein
MTNDFQPRIVVVDIARREALGLWQATRSAQWLLLCVSLTVALTGCSKATKHKASSDEQPAAAKAEEKAEAPAEQPPAKAEKKAEEKPAAAPAPVARHRPEDPTKWELADLKSALAAHDVRFVPAVLFYSMQNQGSKRAKELQELLATAGQMKDDSSIGLPLPPPPAPTPVTAAKPAMPAPSFTPGSGGAFPNLGKRPSRVSK